jgi:hypothetical protein
MRPARGGHAAAVPCGIDGPDATYFHSDFFFPKTAKTEKNTSSSLHHLTLVCFFYCFTQTHNFFISVLRVPPPAAPV